jgi:hypothetical protein
MLSKSVKDKFINHIGGLHYDEPALRRSPACVLNSNSKVIKSVWL